MNRIWSVLTGPYLVLTVLPSTMGRMSRWTPSRETSGPWPPSRLAILSISSMKMMPLCSVRSRARALTFSMSTSFSASDCMSISRASATFIRRRLVFLGKRLPNISLMLMPISSVPWGVKISIIGILLLWVSTSTERSLSSPLRSSLRSFSRVDSRASVISCPGSPSAVLSPGQQQVEQALLGQVFGLDPHRSAPPPP